MNTYQAAQSSSPESRKSQTDLQNRYGRIALSAVAAAMSYGSVKKAEEKAEDSSETPVRN